MKRVPIGPSGCLRRYPRLVAHMICESMGYWLPWSAGLALEHVRLGQPNWCEWFIADCNPHPGENLDAATIRFGYKVVGDAFRRRARHAGYRDVLAWVRSEIQVPGSTPPLG